MELFTFERVSPGCILALAGLYWIFIFTISLVQFQVFSEEELKTDEHSLFFLNHLASRIKNNDLRLGCLALWYRFLTKILLRDHDRLPYVPSKMKGKSFQSGSF
jgi:hypothetical protein